MYHVIEYIQKKAGWNTTKHRPPHTIEGSGYILLISFLNAGLLTIGSFIVLILNVILDTNTINFILEFKQFHGNLLIPSLIALLWYQGIFTLFFITALMLQKHIRLRYGRNVSVWMLVLSFLGLLIIRIMIMEPYLFETFYTTIPPFAFFMDAVLYFDIKWIVDTLLICALLGSIVILIRRPLFISLLIICAIIALVRHLPQPVNSTTNKETIILIMADSLRKDIVDNNNDLFLNTLFKKSTVIENMYTVFPASVPTLAGIFSGQYPYTYRSTAVSLDAPMDLSFALSIKKTYRLSLHTDFTDDDIVNRKNFNIPFDEVHAPLIDYTSNLYANVLTRNIVLLALIPTSTLRTILLPQLYRADTNTNSTHTIQEAINYLSANKKNRKIAMVSLGDAHVPYRATYPFYRSFLQRQHGSLFRWTFEAEDFLYTGTSSEANANIRNLYEMSVRRLDNHIKYFIEQLAANHLLENTKVVILADQGENIYDSDLKLFGHNNLDTQHVLKVPFAIYQHDQPGAIVNHGNYALLDTLNIALHSDSIEDYARTAIYIESDVDLNEPNNPLFITNISDVLDTNDINAMRIIDKARWQQFKRRAIVYGDHILIYHPYRSFPYALYHINDDPLFRNNLQSSEPELFTLMRQQLDTFTKDADAY